MSVNGTMPGGGSKWVVPQEPSRKSRPARPDVPWGAKDSAFITLLVIVSVIVCLIVFYIVLTAAGIAVDSSQNSLISEVGSNIVFYSAILLACLLFFRFRHYSVSLNRLGFRRTPLGKALLWTLLIFFLDFSGSIVWVSLVQNEAPPVKAEYGATVPGFILAYLGIAILAPVVEELFFRGVLFQGFSKSFGWIWGGVASAAVFTIFHVDPHVYGRIFWTGILFAFLYYKTRSLWPSIVCHFLVNSMAVIAMFTS